MKVPRTHAPLSALLLVAIPLATLSSRAAPTDSPPPQISIDRCDYPDDASAAKAWRPMKDTPPAASFASGAPDPARSLLLRCRFAGTDVERASWDRQVDLNLGDCRRISFRILARDLDPISQFSIYFQSGDGWYSSSFHPDVAGSWTTVTIEKSRARTEGKPAGWSKIRTIRISAWRANRRDTEFLLADLRKVGSLGADVSIALIQADPSPDRASDGTDQYAEITSDLLESAGLPHAVFTESDVSPERLAHARAIVLPHNPTMAAPVADAIARHVASGKGKLIALFSVPAPLRAALGVNAGKFLKEPRPGHFASIALDDPASIRGAPTSAKQHSWNIHAWQPIPGESQTIAQWRDDRGQSTGQPAIILSPSGAVFTHVLTPEDPARKRQLLLSLIGHLYPDAWGIAARHARSQIAADLPDADFDTTAAAIGAADAARGRAQASLDAARDARAKCDRALATDDPAAAIEHAHDARRLLVEAYCRAQRSVPDEFRAFWCHDAYGVRGIDWDQAIRRLAENGFNAIVPNMLWGGAAFFPSQVLPVAQAVETRGDAIAQCVEACRKHGVKIHVWKVNWNLGHAVPDSFKERMRAEGRLQQSGAGEIQPWLCPSHPENRKLEIDSMLEVARRYPVDGLHFDYIRYPNNDHCFCPGCRQRFESAIGAKAEAWPKDALRGGALAERWLDWRRKNIDAVVRAVSERAREIRPGIQISAAVFRNWTTDRDSVGQDWKLWCDRGWLDFVCPMDYTPSNALFENMVSHQLPWAGRVPCYPGIGASASSSRLGAPGVIAQIQITRKHRTGGFIIFNYGTTEAEELVPQLGLGITRPQEK